MPGSNCLFPGCTNIVVTPEKNHRNRLRVASSTFAPGKVNFMINKWRNDIIFAIIKQRRVDIDAKFRYKFNKGRK